MELGFNQRHLLHQQKPILLISSESGLILRFVSFSFSLYQSLWHEGFKVSNFNSKLGLFFVYLKSDRFSIHRLELLHGTRKVRGSSIRMALVDERRSTSNDVAEPPRILVYMTLISLSCSTTKKIDTLNHFGFVKIEFFEV